MANFDCITWGGPPRNPQLVHGDCFVVATKESIKDNRPALPIKGPLPQVCPCECQTCKRAWWAYGRPIIRDGKIVRETEHIGGHLP